MTRICRVITLSLSIVLHGCSTTGSGSYRPTDSLARDTQRAQELSSRAAECMEHDPVQAEVLLREALTADLWHGPAHNNLGVLFLKQGKLYEAAGEFEWARTLMPGHPDPRLNLALTLERAGRIDEALGTYATALEVYPEYLPAIQALARCQVRNARYDDRTRELLREIWFRADDAAWREWARLQLTLQESGSQ